MRYSLADIKRSYTPEKAWSEMQGDLPCYLIYRPISFVVALVLLWLRVPVLAVTFSSAVVALAMVTIAWWGGESAWLGVVGFGFAFHVLDCTDGNMARTMGRSSQLGALLDGTIDMAFWCLLFLSTGLLVGHEGGGIFGDAAEEFSLGLAILILLNRQTRDSFEAQNAEVGYFREEIPERVHPRDWLVMVFVGLEFVYVPAIGVGFLLGGLDWVLLGMGVYVVVISLAAFWVTFAKAYRLDRTTSSSDPR